MGKLLSILRIVFVGAIPVVICSSYAEEIFDLKRVYQGVS